MTKGERVLHMGGAIIFYATMIFASISSPSATPAGIAIIIAFVEMLYWGYMKKVRLSGFFWATLIIGGTLVLVYRLAYSLV